MMKPSKLYPQLLENNKNFMNYKKLTSRRYNVYRSPVENMTDIFSHINVETIVESLGKVLPQPLNKYCNFINVRDSGLNDGFEARGKSIRYLI